jgi:hypothetical protein
VLYSVSISCGIGHLILGWDKWDYIHRDFQRPSSGFDHPQFSTFLLFVVHKFVRTEINSETGSQIDFAWYVNSSHAGGPSEFISQVINAGDVLTFLCGGFYPATQHRVGLRFRPVIKNVYNVIARLSSPLPTPSTGPCKGCRERFHISERQKTSCVYVKYRFLIETRRRSEIRLRDEVRISKTKGSKCRGKVSESERNTEPVYWKGRGLASARALRLSLCLVPNFRERLGGGRKSERKSIGRN